jgi:hypothetical protein
LPVDDACLQAAISVAAQAVAPVAGAIGLFNDVSGKWFSGFVSNWERIWKYLTSLL